MDYKRPGWELVLRIADMKDRKNKGKKTWALNCERHAREHPED